MAGNSSPGTVSTKLERIAELAKRKPGVVLRRWVQRIWQKWLYRRSWKAGITWVRMNRLLAVFPLPPARVVHSIYRVANP